MAVKPSAQPTLVRTQHLPPAEVAGHDWYAKIARPLKVSGVLNRRLSLRRVESSTWRHHLNSPWPARTRPGADRVASAARGAEWACAAGDAKYMPKMITGSCAALAHDHLDHARQIAEQIGEDRDDYGTEFGPSNVAIHAVSVAVILGDAGQALDLARTVDVACLSAERRARYLIDLAAAHAMRRQIGEAIHDLQLAEHITPEQTRTHRVARDVTRDLLQLCGLRPRPELRELAERFGVLP